MPRLRLVSAGAAVMKRFASGLCVGLLLAGSCGSAAHADGVIPQTEVRYRVFAHGFKVMDIQASYRLGEMQCGVAARVSTGGFASWFVKTNLQLSGQGSFNGQAAEPTVYDSMGWSRGANRRVSMMYRDHVPDVTRLDPPETNREPVPDADRKGAIDTLAVLMDLLHQVRSTQSCGGQTKLFDGMRLSTITLHSAGLQRIPSGGPLDWGRMRCGVIL